ncbi:hypothetical protein TNCV_595681 [Trichonephila clavipes]|nr:hypothetical protein TNCV_595681 [Trichonephila clavipes]
MFLDDGQWYFLPLGVWRRHASFSSDFGWLLHPLIRRSESFEKFSIAFRSGLWQASPVSSPHYHLTNPWWTSQHDRWSYPPGSYKDSTRKNATVEEEYFYLE